MRFSWRGDLNSHAVTAKILKTERAKEFRLFAQY